jgi:hypothetical protein
VQRWRDGKALIPREWVIGDDEGDHGGSDHAEGDTKGEPPLGPSASGSCPSNEDQDRYRKSTIRSAKGSPSRLSGDTDRSREYRCGPMSDLWDPDPSELHVNVGNSSTIAFVRAHSASDVIREAVQNEYDAGGDTVNVVFGQGAVTITGNGKGIDAKGWRRLALMQGTGYVAATRQIVEAKTNSIGSKNAGVKSLFRFGDRIHISSRGRQSVLDLRYGAPDVPRLDPATRKFAGARITVPYRTADGDLEAFEEASETTAFDEFVENLAESLIKLARPLPGKSLKKLSIRS